VQDVWMKWHLADTSEVHTPMAWLTTITTRVAIDRLRHLQRERAAQTTGWLPEPWLDDMAPSAEELALRSAQMSYGVMLMLERLKPDERAAFVLHEGFDCDYAEIAKILDRTPAACRQIVHRAKERLQRAGAPLQRPDPVRHTQLVERLRAALEAQDTDDLLKLFSDAPQVMSDMPERVNEPVTVATSRHKAVGTVASLSAAVEADCMEPVTINGALGVALLRDGEIVALIDVTDLDGQIVALRIVTSGARLMAANRVCGLSAVRLMLRALNQRSGYTHAPQPSATMRGHFPVDIHA
jgi:RNA polymerase sigma factor (sigma-70 family)